MVCRIPCSLKGSREVLSRQPRSFKKGVRKKKQCEVERPNDYEYNMQDGHVTI